MISTIEQINSVLNGLVWGFPAIVAVIGVGLFLTVNSGFIQFRRFVQIMKTVTGADEKDKTKKAAAGSMTPFQSMCTALAATVGTGSLAGVAGAIALGGPGAVFWMWVAALIGMCIKFAEVTLAVYYREKNSHGDWVGGPMYYIKNGLSSKWQFLGYMFAGCGVLTVFGTGNATQVNTITVAIDQALLSFNVIGQESVFTTNLVIGIIISAITLMIMIGGIKRIGAVTEKLVPFMAAVYIILGLGVMLLNYGHIPVVLEQVIEGAFNPGAVTGGVVGSMFACVKLGISRGVFSNEAGLGTGPIAHASADTKHPVEQGMYGVFEVFTTIIICTLTAFVILCANDSINYGAAAGAELTIQGFVNSYGSWVTIFTALAMICFALSTVLGWGLYGSRCIEYIFGTKSIKGFTIIYGLFPVVGATADLSVVWGVSDTFNGLMVIPNLIAVLLLSGTFFRLAKEYFTTGQEEISFDAEYIAAEECGDFDVVTAMKVKESQL